MKRLRANSNELAARNRDIYDKRENGALVVQLSHEYGISVPRIHRICVQEENKVLKEENDILKDQLRVCNLKLKGDK